MRSCDLHSEGAPPARAFAARASPCPRPPGAPRRVRPPCSAAPCLCPCANASSPTAPVGAGGRRHRELVRLTCQTKALSLALPDSYDPEPPASHSAGPRTHTTTTADCKAATHTLPPHTTQTAVSPRPSCHAVRACRITYEPAPNACTQSPALRYLGLPILTQSSAPETAISPFAHTQPTNLI